MVRIEDVDTVRSRCDASESILTTLAAYGFEWDGAVVRQSDRCELYQSAFADLVRHKLVFACSCTRKELESAPYGPAGERIYPGTCREGVAQGRQARAWRAAVPGESIGFTDRLQGWQEQQLARDVGDFVVRRADGLFAYQLAVVVDDAEQGITDVVRGADLLPSTPRQIWLQRALSYPTPAYLHHPIALDPYGVKLSKQSGATALAADPLPALRKAWRFLDQREPPATPGCIREFWQWAHSTWDSRRLPPVAMLPHAIIAV